MKTNAIDPETAFHARLAAVEETPIRIAAPHGSVISVVV